MSEFQHFLTGCRRITTVTTHYYQLWAVIYCQVPGTFDRWCFSMLEIDSYWSSGVTVKHNTMIFNVNPPGIASTFYERSVSSIYKKNLVSVQFNGVHRMISSWWVHLTQSLRFFVRGKNRNLICKSRHLRWTSAWYNQLSAPNTCSLAKKDWFVTVWL